jgi:spore coat polysaccharide biosynthesis protein SpsF
MTNAIFLSGRNKSRRLPKKLFLPLLDSTTLEVLIARLKKSEMCDRLFMATSDHSDDYVFEEVCEPLGVPVFHGSQDDKLVRYRDLCRQEGIDNVVVVDADDLLADPGVIDVIFCELEKGGRDYVIMDDLPLGATGFGVTKASLEKVCDRKTISDTEVWGQLFADDPVFSCVFLKPEKALVGPDYRLTLDYEDDYKLFDAIYSALHSVNPEFGLAEVVKFLGDNPDVEAINDHSKSIYDDNIKKQLEAQLSS